MMRSRVINNKIFGCLSTLFILYHSSFVSEHLGADVEWFENEYKVVITKPEKK